MKISLNNKNYLLNLFVFFCFFNLITLIKVGKIVKKDSIKKRPINWGFNINSSIRSELGLEIILTCSPIPAIINVPGNIPKKVVKKTTLNFIFKIAGAKLTIQNGKIGKKRKKSRYLN